MKIFDLKKETTNFAEHRCVDPHVKTNTGQRSADPPLVGPGMKALVKHTPDGVLGGTATVQKSWKEQKSAQV